MTPVEYTKHVRFVGILVMVLLGTVSAVIFKTECCDDRLILPLIVVGFGMMYLYLYSKTKQVICQKCGGSMKISSGFPTIEFKCERCMRIVDAKIHSDY